MKDLNKKEIDKVVGKVIKEFRIKKGLIQEELADRLNTSQKYISRVENGASGLGDAILIKCLNELEIAPNTLYEEFMTNENIKKTRVCIFFRCFYCCIYHSRDTKLRKLFV